MPRHVRRVDKQRIGIAVAAVMALAGVLFTANARLASQNDDRDPESLQGFLASEEKRMQERSTEVDELRARWQELTASHETAIGSALPDQTQGVLLDSGAEAVSGPGVRVELNDAPVAGVRPPGVRPDDLVVHQGDVEAVINALWRGGAEAIMVQDQRIVSTTAVRCVGNSLLLHGNRYSPPYAISAIGDAEKLRAALDASQQVAIYREWVDAVGLGWSLADKDDIQMPAYSGRGTALRYAEVIRPDAS